jgi:hypothetical protein
MILRFAQDDMGTEFAMDTELAIYTTQNDRDGGVPFPHDSDGSKHGVNLAHSFL